MTKPLSCPPSHQNDGNNGEAKVVPFRQPLQQATTPSQRKNISEEEDRILLLLAQHRFKRKDLQDLISAIENKNLESIQADTNAALIHFLDAPIIDGGNIDNLEVCIAKILDQLREIISQLDQGQEAIQESIQNIRHTIYLHRLEQILLKRWEPYKNEDCQQIKNVLEEIQKSEGILKNTALILTKKRDYQLRFKNRKETKTKNTDDIWNPLP